MFPGFRGGVDADALTKAARSDLADSALHAPQAGFGDVEFYPDIYDKAAVLASPNDRRLTGPSMPVTARELELPLAIEDLRLSLGEVPAGRPLMRGDVFERTAANEEGPLNGSSPNSRASWASR
jgi:hypothetical protein